MEQIALTFIVMTTVGISEAKAKLSEYLAKVKGGHEVLITERGRPIALLVPPRAADARLAELERAGVLRAPERPLPEDFFERERPRAKHPGSALSALLEERHQGR